MSRLAISVFSFVFVMIVSLMGVPPGARAAEQAKVMIVLDASGSMWGRVDNTPKILIARQTIRDLLRKWDSNIQLGLSAYGHRSKGDCGDIETLYPVGAADPATIVKVVDSLQPKGMTPISEAVRRAAQQLKFTEQKATVILISDGKETCKADPCAVGRELKAAGIDFTVHVVGFNVKREEQSGLKCLAENTGGLFISADNAASLNKAVATAVTRVKEEAKTVVVQAKPKPAPKPAAKPGHLFSAVLNENGPAATSNMAWTIYEAQANLQGKRKRVTYSYDAEPLFKLNPGKYLLVAKWGNAEKQVEFEVKSAGEAVRHVVNLDAGLLALEALYAEGSEVIKSGMAWTVFDLEKDLQGKQKRITYSYDAKPTFRLPAGKFQIIAKRGNATLSREIAVDAGKRSDEVYNMNAGLLAPSGILAPGKPALAKGMAWTIFATEKNLEGKRARITYSYDAKPTFTLNEGKYLLITKNGNAEKSTEVEVKAGKRNDAEINLDAGQVKLVAMSKDGTTLSKGTAWTIYGAEKNLEGKRTRVTYSYDATPIFTLNAGKYIVAFKSGALKTEAELEVAAGDSKQVDVKVD